MSYIELQIDEPGRAYLGECKYDTLLFEHRTALDNWLDNVLPTKATGTKWRLRGAKHWNEVIEDDDDRAIYTQGD